jgi:hypothetical protein
LTSKHKTHQDKKTSHRHAKHNKYKSKYNDKEKLYNTVYNAKTITVYKFNFLYKIITTDQKSHEEGKMGSVPEN